MVRHEDDCYRLNVELKIPETVELIPMKLKKSKPATTNLLFQVKIVVILEEEGIYDKGMGMRVLDASNILFFDGGNRDLFIW